MNLKIRSHLLISIVLSLTSVALYGRGQLQFQIGDEVGVYSDKAYRRGSERILEAVGNVVITHKTETLYGEIATLSFDTGNLDMRGNVRYISSEMTLYGSELHYNLNSQALLVQDARIVTEAYYLMAKEIQRVGDREFLAKEAEYSTCRDCPESWSVYGDDVKIVMGDYIYIKHAMIKVNGIVVIYLPYIVLPIKKGRQTGLLFPKFGISFSKGVTYQQPWFWAINDSKDLTLSPSQWGSRGTGTEVQYRQKFAEKSWLELNTLGVFDRIYLPGKVEDYSSGRHFFRNFSSWEQHYQKSNNFSSHWNLTYLRDSDTLNDFNDFSRDYIEGNEVGVKGFANWRSSFWDFNFDTAYSRNTMREEVLSFDDSYVQIMPRLSLEMIPVTLLQGVPGFKNLSFGMENNATVFQQNHINEDLYLRNASRFILNPYFDWHVLNMGPVSLKALYDIDYNYYKFRDTNQASFTKYGSKLNTTVSFEADKIFGLSYVEEVPMDSVPPEVIKKIKKEKVDESKKEKVDHNLIAQLPSFERELTKDHIVKVQHSYRHAQEYNFIHHYTTAQKTRGNTFFKEQIKDPNGIFDLEDTVVTRQHLIGDNASRTDIPALNTVELQWNNSLIKKESRRFNYLDDYKYLRDNFRYNRMAYLNFSQGFEMADEGKPARERLTRLHGNTGISLLRWSASLSDYYFYQNGRHIFSASFVKSFDMGRLYTNHTWNSFPAPSKRRVLRVGGDVTPIDLFSLGGEYEYDMDTNEKVMSNYFLTYRPKNNCWKIKFSYGTSLLGNKFGLNFFVNFADNKFTALGRGEDE